MRRWLWVRALVALALCGSTAARAGEASASILRDAARSRDVPVWIHEAPGCRPSQPCPVVLLSPGWGVPATAYGFVVDALVRSGYGVVAVQDQLPGDPAMPSTGDIRRDRTPTWLRGVATLRFVREVLSARLQGYDWQRVVLLGGSHGGDVSALLAGQQPGWVSALVTLDHRRVPLPPQSQSHLQSPGLRVLSLRGSDFPADPGVLPAEPEAGVCILRLADARHDDMHDGGPERLKARLAAAIVGFLVERRCSD